MDRTEGKLKQTTELAANVLLRTPEERATRAADASARLRAILNPNAN